MTDYARHGNKGTMRICHGEFAYMDMKWRISMVDGEQTFLWICPVCDEVVCAERLEEVEVA